MEDFANTTLSTTLTDEPTPAASGGGAPTATNDEPVKGESVRDTLERASRQVKAEEVKQTPKEEAEQPARIEEKPEGKPKAEEAAKAEPKAGDAKDGESDPKPSEGRKTVEAPARLLPKARELWRNVPHELRSELDRLSREDQEEITRYKEASERYNDVREYDELARSNGTTLKQAVDSYHRLENLIRENPLAGLNQILMEAGPKKADGQPISLWELANGLVQGGQQNYAQIVGQRPQQQEQPDTRYQALEQELAQLKVQQLQTAIIEPFKAQHDRYDELSPHIATILESDMIPKALGPLEKLAHAYDMAERLFPRMDDDQGSKSADDRGGMSSGSKSIKSTPGAATVVSGDDDKNVSIRDAINRAAKKVALRG